MPMGWQELLPAAVRWHLGGSSGVLSSDRGSGSSWAVWLAGALYSSSACFQM